MLVDFHAKAFHSRQHFRANVLPVIDWVYRKIAALHAGSVAGIAHFIIRICVPRSILRVDLIGDFVNAVGKLSETEGHHPDIAFGWGYVKIKIFTHAIEGLAESDFILAAKIDKKINV